MVTAVARRMSSAPLVGLIGAGTILLVGLILAPGVRAGDPCYHGFDIPQKTEASETQIKVGPCFFGPTVAHVAVGATVTFFNGPGFTHLITGANAEWGSRDVELKPEQQVSYTFDEPGVYPYACALHRGMSGAIVVGDTAGEPVALPPAVSGDSTATNSPAVAGPTVVAATGAGMVLGAAGLWLVARRRRVRTVV